MHPFARHLLTLALGALAVAAWAPLAWWPLALLAYGLMFSLIGATARPVAAASAGLRFGLGLHLTGHGWIYSTMAGPVGMDSASAVLATALLLTGLALFTALPCALHVWLLKNFTDWIVPYWLQAASFASLMTLAEMARALVFERFSSLSLGYALMDTWLAGWAPVLGAYGLSWIGYWMAATLALSMTPARQTAPRRLQAAIPVVTCLLMGLLLLQVQWTAALAKPLHFRLLQPHTLQDSKFDLAFRAGISQQLLDLLTAEPADLVVAPETAFPMYWNELPGGTLSALHDFATQSGSHLVFGIATVGNQAQGHNSLVHLQPHGTGVSRYDKIHLFPFGEYAPPGLGWISRKLAIPMQDLSPGAAAQPPFTLVKQGQTLAIGSLICHENMLSDEVRRWAPKVNLLINPGNMAWFDGTLAVDQGQQITRMRALEVGRPILRVSNTGDTALILASGAVADALPVGVAASLAGTVTGRTGLTPYVRWGDWPVSAICLLGIASALWVGKANPRRWLPSQKREVEAQASAGRADGTMALTLMQAPVLAHSRCEESAPTPHRRAGPGGEWCSGYGWHRSARPGWPRCQSSQRPG